MTQIAILGCGIVGSGVDEIIRESAALIKARRGVTLSVKSILDIRPMADERVVTDFALIENDPAIAAVVESIGGCGAAFEFSRRALKAKKHVVTSNKELVAEHGAELLALAREHGVHYLFEASVGGGIPVIHPLAQCLSANAITDIAGILNGTSNYILTRMRDNGFTFDEALLEAQKLGYAESDPSADVDGHDACRKICILADLAFGRHIPPARVSVEGIRRITPKHLQEATGNGYHIKLLGIAAAPVPQPQLPGNGLRPWLYVAPHLVGKEHPLYNVDDVYNGIVLRGSVTGDVMFYGRGAGKRPTASAIVSDVLDCLLGGDPLGGLAWSRDALDIAPPPPPTGFTFADGSVMWVLA